MKSKWWLKMLPYLIIVIWTVAITIFVFNNTTIVNNNSLARAKAICIATDKVNSAMSTMIIKLGEESDGPDKLVWKDLESQLGPQLKPIDCDNITVDGKPK